MTVISQYHPDKNVLAEYSAGSLDYAQAIAVSAHLHYCPRCRADVKALEKIGGALLETLESNDNDANTDRFDQLMARIDRHSHRADEKIECQQQQDTQFTVSATEIPSSRSQHIVTRTSHPQANANTKYAYLPHVIRKMLSDQPLHWKRVNTHLKSASLTSGQNQYAVSLQNIQAGGRVPEHNHRGSEITVVLKGSFSDEDGIYHAGDFLLRQPGDIHRPRASDNEDCLCLSIEQAPVKLTGFIGRLINPFLKIQAV